nr:DUF5615 family PIN-like protein [Bacteroidota bacterium]
MKILLDECITKQLKNYLEEFVVYTVRELKLSGIKNGQLLTFCCDNSFDVLLTIDKSMAYQQNLDKYPITIVVLNCSTSKIEQLVEFLPSFKLQIEGLEKNKAYIIDK